MDLMSPAISRQAKWEHREFSGTAMQWLEGQMNPATAHEFPFLRVRWDELILVKQAAITLAAMQFAVHYKDRFFAGAERVAAICQITERTVRAHWKTLVEAKLIKPIKSDKNSSEFRFNPASNQKFYMLPIAFRGLDTYGERMLCAMVLTNAAKVMTEDADDWSYQVVCAGRSNYLHVSADQWTNATGLTVRHLYRARQSLEAKNIITVHGSNRRFMVPFGDQKQWDDVRPHLDLER